MILNMLWNLMAVFGIIVCFFAFVIAICLVAAPHDRRAEDEEQIKYLKSYRERKGDKQ